LADYRGEVDSDVKKPYIFSMVVVLQDIVREISKATKLALPDSKTVVRRILETLKKGMESGKRIEIRDFGVFRVKTVSGKKGRDLARNLTIFLPSYRKVSFRAGKNLRRIFWDQPAPGETQKKETPSGMKSQMDMFPETSKL
jgi:integration host factor subunit beta